MSRPRKTPRTGKVVPVIDADGNELAPDGTHASAVAILTARGQRAISICRTHIKGRRVVIMKCFHCSRQSEVDPERWDIEELIANHTCKENP